MGVVFNFLRLRVNIADTRGVAYYWLAGTGWPKIDVVGTDMHALKDGYISITPLGYDLTDNAFLKEVEAWEWDK